MGTYAVAGFAVYNGTSGTITFDEISLTALTLDDGEADNSFEIGDTIFSTLPYEGSFDIPLAAGGTQTLPAFSDTGDIGVAIPNGADPSDYSFPATLDMNTIDTADFPTCFGAGTAIATPDGPRAVETLAISDLVLTADGAALPVRWLGRQTLRPHWAGAKHQPIRIQAGALGDGLPLADLTITADHALVLDGRLVNAGACVNGDSIAYIPVADLPDAMVVYHIETEAHAVILANGTPAETFLDAAGRTSFDNYADYVALYGADRIMPEMPLPRIASARMLPEALRARLGLATPDVDALFRVA